ncbi:hypothetical protein Ddye_028354 [Dipteronia dyeriana]|uniref:Uncharacterized protein n=1 Tax=Dipteronia dyeriana TaxID=168575 RepID=A0AAD9WR33_9ROSI|nr:hypothetical protein Ddye_028354 [Dipteronia dyeriana]
MDIRTFVVLCELLCNTGRLKTDGLVCIEEQVYETYITVHVPEVDKPRFRSRKGEIATNVLGKTTYTTENLAADVDVGDNFDNEFEMPGNFSPMSVNQTDSCQPMHPTSSQPLSKKMSKSGDPIVRSMDRFANVMNNAIEKSNDTLDKFCQVLVKNKMSENQVIAND